MRFKFCYPLNSKYSDDGQKNNGIRVTIFSLTRIDFIDFDRQKFSKLQFFFSSSFCILNLLNPVQHLTRKKGEGLSVILRFKYVDGKVSADTV